AWRPRSRRVDAGRFAIVRFARAARCALRTLRFAAWTCFVLAMHFSYPRSFECTPVSDTMFSVWRRGTFHPLRVTHARPVLAHVAARHPAQRMTRRGMDDGEIEVADEQRQRGEHE